ncbi:hypothetical protein BW143_22325, partial [Bacillus swezeyi]
MEQLDLIIKNGKVVLSTGVVEIDIGIKDGKIAIIQKGITAKAEREWDAANQYVFPGMIDV